MAGAQGQEAARQEQGGRRHGFAATGQGGLKEIAALDREVMIVATMIRAMAIRILTAVTAC